MSTEFLTEQVALSKLKVHPKNARKHPDRQIEAIMASIERFGYVYPFVISRRSGLTLDGHGRITAAHRLGHKVVPATYLDLDAAGEERFIATLNRTYELGENDPVALGALLKSLAEEPEGLPTGWNEEEVGDLLLKLAGAGDEGIEEPGGIDPEADDIPETIETRAKAGDIWQLGEHRLAVGSSTDAELVRRLLAQDSIRMVWTDPPYGVSYADKNAFLNAQDKGNRNQTPIQNDSLSMEQTEELTREALILAAGYGLPGAAVYVACPAGTPLPYFIRAVAMSGFQYRHSLAWVKNNFVLGRCDYHYRHETILYGWKEGGHYFVDEHNHSSVFEVPKPYRSEEHPTMKPVELIARMVRNSSKPSEIVYDPFGGSGSTLIACEELNRRCRTVELAPGYADVILARYEKLTGQTAQKLN